MYAKMLISQDKLSYEEENKNLCKLLVLQFHGLTSPPGQVLAA